LTNQLEELAHEAKEMARLEATRRLSIALKKEKVFMSSHTLSR
jgi:hypothetical protein